MEADSPGALKAELKLHPACACAVLGGISTTARRRGEVLLLTFEAQGAVGDLVLPAKAPAVRTDGLWRATCFEAFVQAPPAEGYVELNLSPSGAWAAYGFDAPRVGVKPADVGRCPVIEMSIEADRLTLVTSIDLSAALPAGQRWRLGLSAVIEAAGSGLSYWALAHGGERPDFHDPATFILTLPQAGT